MAKIPIDKALLARVAKRLATGSLTVVTYVFGNGSKQVTKVNNTFINKKSAGMITADLQAIASDCGAIKVFV